MSGRGGTFFTVPGVRADDSTWELEDATGLRLLEPEDRALHTWPAPSKL